VRVVDVSRATRTGAPRIQRDALRDLKAKLPSSVAVFRKGFAWQQTLLACEEAGSDLIVMGTHGRQGLSHALIGSVAEKVVRLSPVPVLTVREPRPPK
jgi:nucleotide-binding universal stress UspA family protein